MRASAELHVDHREGRDRVTRLRSQVPLVLRVHGHTLHLVGGAAGPLSGDETSLSIRVGAGGHLAVRSAGAAMALPGRAEGPSSSRVHVEVGEGAVFDWAPEPFIAVAGSHHLASVVIELAATAVLRWQEVIVLGRYGEPPGLLETSLDVTRGDVPLLRQQHAWGSGAPTGWDGPAGIGNARVVATSLEVGRVTAGPAAGRGAASLEIAEDARLHLALGACAPEVRALVPSELLVR